MNPQYPTAGSQSVVAQTLAAQSAADHSRLASRSAEQATPATWRKLFQQIHSDERGGVSIETILIIAAIALPILIFIIKFGWPRIRKFFNEGMDELEGGALDAAAGE